MSRAPDRTSAIDLRCAYSTDPEWLERQYGLLSLRGLMSDPEVVGATRLVVLDSFEPERFVTCEFRGSEVRISIIKGATSLWWSLPRQVLDGNAGGVPTVVRGPRFDAGQANLTEARLAAKSAPPPFQDWDAVKALVVQSPSCQQECLDGVGYRHRLCSRDLDVSAEWANPEERNNPNQMELLRGYRRLAEAAGLQSPFLPGRRKWWPF